MSNPWTELRNALTFGQAFNFVNSPMGVASNLICRWYCDDYHVKWSRLPRWGTDKWIWTIQVWQEGHWVDIGSDSHRFGMEYFGQPLPLICTKARIGIKKAPAQYYYWGQPVDGGDDYIYIGDYVSISPEQYMWGTQLLAEIDISGPPFYYPYKLGLIPSGTLWGVGARYPTIFSPPFCVWYGGRWLHQNYIPYQDLPPAPFGPGPNRGAGGGAVVTVETEEAITPERVGLFYLDVITSTSIVASLTVTEDSDTASFTTDVTAPAENKLAVTEEPDTAQFAGTTVKPPVRRNITVLKGKV